jgi:hypothetical protein
LKRWVAAGARIKGKEELPLETAEAENSVSDEERQFWAFRLPERRNVPVVRAMDSVRTPIDAFLLAKLEERGLSFNADAPKLTLLRRACFDLVGLPPTLEQVTLSVVSEPNA